MNRRLFALIAGAALTMAANTYAHHSQVAVYKTNDERARIKRQVNTLLKSEIVEEKQYSAY